MKQKLVLFSVLILLLGCKRTEYSGNLPDIYYYLTEEQIAKTPYFTNPKFDTLTFTSNKGDTLIFAKQRTDTGFYRTGYSSCPGCPAQHYNHQQLRNTYQTIQGNGKFEVLHSKLTYGGYYDNILVTFNDDVFHINDNWLDKSYKYDYWLNDFTVGNKQYFDVIFAFSKLGNPLTNRMYLSKAYGCFYIDLIDKNTNWVLIK